jgi:iron complex transport system ATP-binding protein
MILDARRLTIRYGQRLAIDGVSLAARPGEILALLGANGSGKSSLLRALAGLQPHDGAIRWDGGAAPRGSIGYMPQDSSSRAALSAFEVVLLGRMRSLALRVGAADLEAAHAAMAEIGIADLAERRIGALSGGQRQMVLIAQVLAGGPRVLLLDEPTSALDIAHQLHVLQLLRDATRQRGLTTIAVLHDLNAAARFADRLALLHRGRLVDIGAPRDILLPASLQSVFDVHVAVDAGSDGHPVVLPLRAAASLDTRRVDARGVPAAVAPGSGGSSS